jgi:hypothetical protein
VIWVDLAKDFQESQLKQETVTHRIKRQCGFDQLADRMKQNHEQFALFLDHTDDADQDELTAAIEYVLGCSTRIKVTLL